MLETIKHFDWQKKKQMYYFRWRKKVAVSLTMPILVSRQN